MDFAQSTWSPVGQGFPSFLFFPPSNSFSNNLRNPSPNLKRMRETTLRKDMSICKILFQESQSPSGYTRQRKLLLALKNQQQKVHSWFFFSHFFSIFHFFNYNHQQRLHPEGKLVPLMHLILHVGYGRSRNVLVAPVAPLSLRINDLCNLYPGKYNHWQTLHV